MNYKKIEQIMMECYEALFQASTPPVSFYDLLKTEERNDRGEKVIPFEDHEISTDEFEIILSEYAKKIKKPYYRKKFREMIHLGCSPNFKKEE